MIKLKDLLSEGKFKMKGKYLYMPDGEVSSIPKRNDRDRLFVKLIESNKTENKEIKLTPDMLNLLGCNKENFLKLIELMDYKYFKKKEEIFLKYTPKKVKFKKEKTKKEFFNNPFNKLKENQFK